MRVTETHGSEGNQVVIAPGGRFTFENYQDFRRAYDGHDPRSKFVIDLSDTDYLDSSALGMLLVLREYAGGDRADIEIRNAKPEVSKILGIACFNRIFKLS